MNERMTSVLTSLGLYSLHPEDGGSMTLRNICIIPHHYSVSHPKRSRHIDLNSVQNIF